MDQSSFIYATCQVGAESALKDEFARRWPELRFAYSRPGFVTFKSAQPLPLDEDVPTRDAVFARATGHSLGKVQGESDAERAAALWQLLGENAQRFTGLHVWERDKRPPGERDYEPRVSQDAINAAKAIRAAVPSLQAAVAPSPDEIPANEDNSEEIATAEESASQEESAEQQESPAPTEAAADQPPEAAPEATPPKLRTWVQQGTLVLDVILVEPETWWVGQHFATTNPSCWPGGFCRITVREPVISRAYYKVEEALQWTGLPFRKGERVADLGCAPGGASQALLARGMRVFGVDPANPDLSLLQNLNFWHEKKRGAEVRLKHFRGIPWLVADMNVAPNYTLDTVEKIVTYEGVDIRGMLLTLKFLDWDMAAEIPDYAFRVRTWGFKHVHVRQLAANRQEVCLAAWRDG